MIYRLILLLSILSCQAIGQKDSITQKQRNKLINKCVKTTDLEYIPAGSFTMGQSDQDTPFQGVIAHTVSVSSFFMQKYELSNGLYLAYIDALRKSDTTYANKQLPDTLVWRAGGTYSERYVEYYFRHPAYQNYPVVGVSYNKIVAYAKWLTHQYNKDPERLFKKVIFRIPTEEEWTVAAKGGDQYAQFPWEGPWETSSDGQKRANFHYVSQASIYRDSVLKVNYRGDTNMVSELKSTGGRLQFQPGVKSVSYFDDVYATVAVDAYKPSNYGLYNMGGNVEEMVDAYYQRAGTLYQFSLDAKKTPLQDPSGITRGGSWKDTGAYVLNYVRQHYPNKDYSSSEMGARLVMQVIDY